MNPSLPIISRKFRTSCKTSGVSVIKESFDTTYFHQLIDFVPNAAGLLGTHNLIISSRSSHELEAMLKPVLVSHGLSADAEQSIQVLSNLRSLSGQLALKLISAPTQQAEALGLALARLYLEYQGALSNQIIVPLDSHLDLYQSSIDRSRRPAVPDYFH